MTCGRIITAVLLTLLPALALAADEPDAPLLVGAPDAVWLVMPQTGKDSGSFRILRRTLDSSWGSDWKTLAGEPRAAVGEVEKLTIAFAGGSLFEYPAQDVDGRSVIAPPSNLLPSQSEILAVCADAKQEGSLFVLASRKHVEAATASQPASASAPATSRSATDEIIITSAPASLATLLNGPASPREVVLLHRQAQRWSQAGVLPLGPDFLRVLSMIYTQDTLYVLCRTGQADHLLALNGSWRPVALPAQEGQNLALVPLGDAPALLRLLPDKSLAMQLLREQAWQGPVVLHVEKQDHPFSTKDPAPLVAWTKDRLAISWQEGDARLFAFATPAGEMTAPQDVSMKQSEILTLAVRVAQAFLPAVLAVTVILMFWPGQPMRTGPFSLPEGLRPAAIWLRGVAAMIDLFPFCMVWIMWLASSGLIPANDVEAFNAQAMVETLLNAPGALVVIVSLDVGYILYCIVMERLAGATLGKMAMHLRVVGEGGRRPTFREIALRNVTKVPETLWPVMLFATIFPLLSRYRQRIGDRIAWTAVIDARSKAVPPIPKAPDNVV